MLKLRNILKIFTTPHSDLKTSHHTTPENPESMSENNLNLWQKQLADAFSNIHKLCKYLQISPNDLPLLPVHKPFPLKVPRSFVDCMERGNPDDPLLRQIIPVQQELMDIPGFISDPVGDIAAVAEAGVIHKYQGRVLLITTGGCAVNCRYCFRRNFPYSDFQLTTQRQKQALDYIAEHRDITEVILSGGDPLLLNDQKMESLLHQLQKIPHLKRIRIHSRLPVVLPARITRQLLNCLAGSTKQIILVIHSNHSNELSDQVANACNQLKNNNVTLLNQSVLLKGVNDSAEQLCKLSEKLFSLGILPYYLHLLDKATGTGHFDVRQEDAIQLMKQVKSQLPGYLVPKLVKEVAGTPHKISM